MQICKIPGSRWYSMYLCTKSFNRLLNWFLGDILSSIEISTQVGTKDLQNLQSEYLEISVGGLLKYIRTTLFSNDNEELSLDIELSFKAVSMNYRLMVIDKKINKEELLKKLEWRGADLTLPPEKKRKFCVLL